MCLRMIRAEEGIPFPLVCLRMVRAEEGIPFPLVCFEMVGGGKGFGAQKIPNLTDR